MTILHFSKTRICYWDNALTNTSDSTPNVNLITPETNSAALYGVAYIKGTDFNWRHVPTNHYGLYLTTSQMQDLLEHHSSITPIKAKITIGHTIPLAQYPGSTNTLQLSFNNTIYSKTYHQPASARLTPDRDFTNIELAYNFMRTFDGHRFVDSDTGIPIRQELPKPNVRFIYPKPDYVDTHSGANNRPNGYVREITVVKGLNDDAASLANIPAYLARTTNYKTFSESVNTTVDQPLLEMDLAVGYAPEFLQDDENLKALYPGENIDEITIMPKKHQTHTISNGGKLLNELWANRDIRSLFRNSNFSYHDAIFLFLNLWPQCKGPGENWSLNDSTISENPFQYTGENVTASLTTQAIGLIQSIMQSMTSFEYHDQWNDAIPHLWIKGNEILDPAGALVNHTFQGTINWSLEVEVIDTIDRPVRDPWKWLNVYRVAQKVIVPGTTADSDSYKYRVKYVKGNPYCSQSDALSYNAKIYCKDARVINTAGIDVESRAPEQLVTGGPNFESTLPSYPESSMVRWQTNLSNLPTTTMIIEGGSGGGPSANTRAKRKRAAPSIIQ